MNTPALWEAVYQRYVTDTGTGGLNQTGSPLITGMFLELAPERQAFPYIVFSVQDEVADDTKGSHFTILLPVFNIYVSKENTVSPLLNSLTVIGRRLTARYHRWQPSVVGSYSFTLCERVGGRLIPTEDEAWHWADEYTVRASVDL
jgi:hypothetical protein